jgi:hypothetical protein
MQIIQTIMSLQEAFKTRVTHKNEFKTNNLMH